MKTTPDRTTVVFIAACLALCIPVFSGMARIRHASASDAEAGEKAENFNNGVTGNGPAPSGDGGEEGLIPPLSPPATGGSSPGSPGDRSGADRDSGSFLVGFRPGLHAARERASVHASFGMNRLRAFRLVPVDVVELPSGPEMDAVLEAYRALPHVAYAEPNYILEVFRKPDDEHFDELWGLSNTGQTGGTEGADIGALQAWETTTGSQDIVVAVIDTGIDYGHEDLAGNMWMNPDPDPELGDLHGARWTGGDGTVTSGDPMDGHGHGTHVAGTIGAVGNNAIGVCGVNWNVSLMAIKFLNDQGQGTTADAIAALEYAVEHGAHISNNSWGARDTVSYSQALKDAITAAGEANHLFVAAAGNKGRNNDTDPVYPASYDSDNILAVASSDHNDNRSGFSNYGPNSVHLAAPGSDIFSTHTDNGYASLSGTSMATPHVAGAAALLLCVQPEASYRDVKQWVMESVTILPQWEDVVISGGRLNAAAAVAKATADYVTVSGYVRTPDGEGIGDVAMSGFSGTGPVTGGDGFYSASLEFGWSGSVVPVKNGYDFTPSSRTYSNLMSNRSGQDYTGERQVYEIGGYVRTGDGAVMEGVLLNGLPGGPVTGEDGFYSAEIGHGWSGTVEPEKAGYEFDPPSRTYTHVTADLAEENYTGAVLTYEISGHVRSCGDIGHGGVLLSGLPGDPVTGEDGFFSAEVEHGWSGTAEPQLSGYVFEPAERGYNNVTTDHEEQDFGIFTDLQHRINKALATGETVVEVPPGNYTASLPVVIAGQNAGGFALVSTHGRDTTFIDAECGDEAIIIAADNVRVEGFWIGNFHETGVRIGADNAQLAANTIDGYCEYCGNSKGIAAMVDAATDASVYGNHIVDAATGILVHGGSGGVWIANNSIVYSDNSGKGGVGLQNRPDNNGTLPTDAGAMNNNIQGFERGADWSANQESQRLRATLNWWGHESGPKQNPENPDGKGDAVFGEVDFQPWGRAPTTGAGRGALSREGEAAEDAVRGAGVAATGAGDTGEVFACGLEAAPPGVPGAGPGASYFRLVMNREDIADGRITEVQFDTGYNEHGGKVVEWFNAEQQEWVAASHQESISDPDFFEGSYVNAMRVAIRSKSHDDPTVPALEDFSGIVFALVPEENGSDGGSSSSSGGGTCFIATAVYGTPMAAEIETLRAYRDRRLLSSAPGRALVEVYYLHSPPVAALIAENEHARALLRQSLRPLISYCRRITDE